MKADAYRQVFSDEETQRLNELVDVVAVRHDEQPNDASLRDPSLAQAEIILSGWGLPRMTDRMLRALPCLKAIFHAAGSVKPFATEEMWARDIRVTSAVDANARPVSEFTYSMIVLSLKRTWSRITAQRELGLYLPEDPHLVGAYGSTVALLGLGRTGRLVLEQIRRLDVRVVAYDPLLSRSEATRLGVELVSLEDAFARAHVVSCHIPLLDETVGMLRREHFAAMRPGATFVNTARGAIVREEDLVSVLEARPDLWAVLDVLAEEPPGENARLPALPNVIVTPHIAGSLGPECRRMARAMLDEIDCYTSGRELRSEVRRSQLSVCA